MGAFSANLRVISAAPMALDNEEARRIARALWGYSRLDQPELEVKAGLNNSRLRSMWDSSKAAPSVNELVTLGMAAGLSETAASAIALYGWEAADPLTRVRDQLNELRERVGALASQTVRNTQELEELRAEGRQTGS